MQVRIEGNSALVKDLKKTLMLQVDKSILLQNKPPIFHIDGIDNFFKKLISSFIRNFSS